MSKSIVEQLADRVQQAYSMNYATFASGPVYRFWFSNDESGATRTVYDVAVLAHEVRVSHQVLTGFGKDCIEGPLSTTYIDNKRGTRKLSNYVQGLRALPYHKWPEGVKIEERGGVVWIERKGKALSQAA